MKRLSAVHRSLFVAVGAAAIAVFSGSAHAEEATGKVVWVDARNSALLLECADGGCAKIPSAKTGETYTFVIPEKMKDHVSGLKEGQQVTVSYEDGKDKGYVLVGVK